MVDLVADEVICLLAGTLMVLLLFLVSRRVLSDHLTGELFQCRRMIGLARRWDAYYSVMKERFHLPLLSQSS
jgi:hypothetical protein